MHYVLYITYFCLRSHGSPHFFEVPLEFPEESFLRGGLSAFSLSGCTLSQMQKHINWKVQQPPKKFKE